MGQSLEAFLQWKLLVSLLLGCTEAVSMRQSLSMYVASEIFVCTSISGCSMDLNNTIQVYHLVLI